MRITSINLFIGGILLLLVATCSKQPLLDGTNSETGAQTDSKSASATYTSYFADTVNSSSWSKWTASNLGGGKAWVLSSANYSPPQSFAIGGLYWNNENDYLTTTNSFSVPANRQGLRFSFHAHWSIASGDFGYVEYSKNGGTTWLPVATYTNGSNPSYPGWDTYSYAIPAPAATSNFKLRFRLTSDGSVSGWGIGVDSISFFQKNISAPLNLTATDGTEVDTVTVDWDANADGTVPSKYYIYRSATQNGTYSYIGQVDYPTTVYDDAPGDHATYWYKVRGYRAGYSYGPFSNSNSGYANWAPEAHITATPTECDPDETVALDATGSTDQDGSVVNFEWDLDANGTFETDTDGDGTTQTSFDSPGIKDVSVRVTDNAGATAVASAEVTVHGWVVVTIDGANSGYSNSLNVINGCPAISYWSTSGITYAHSTSSHGANASDWALVQVATGGGETSLLQVDGSPAIAYGAVSSELNYAKSTTADGADEGDWVHIGLGDGSGGRTGGHVSMKIVSGNPAIAYSFPNLYFARSSTIDGLDAGDWSFVNLPETNCEMTSLCVVSNCPGISYWDLSQGLKFAKATTSTGDDPADWILVAIGGGGTNDGWYSSLGVVDGNPAIASIQLVAGNGGIDSRLRYSYSADADGESPSDWTSMTIQEVVGSPNFASLALIQSYPSVVCFDEDEQSLKLLSSSTTDGNDSSDWQTQTVTSTGASTLYWRNSLIELGNNVAVSFSSSGGLKYAVML